MYVLYTLRTYGTTPPDFGAQITVVLLFGAAASSGLPVSFLAVYAVGFIAAVTIGSIAWYNSKRPPGWEDKDKPDFLPTVKSEDDDGAAS